MEYSYCVCGDLFVQWDALYDNAKSIVFTERNYILGVKVLANSYANWFYMFITKPHYLFFSSQENSWKGKYKVKMKKEYETNW